MQLLSLRRFWPFDAAITIAAFALIVSVVHLAINSPLLLDLYLKPKLVVTNVASEEPQTDYAAFLVHNDGSRKAKSVELGIIGGENDIIKVLPNLGASITHNSSVRYRTYRIVVPYLSPKEGFTVIVHFGPESPREISGNLDSDPPTSLRGGPLPAVSYFRSESGPGEVRSNKFHINIVATPRDKQSSNEP